MPKEAWFPGAWGGQKGGGKRETVYSAREMAKEYDRGFAAGMLAACQEPAKKFTDLYSEPPVVPSLDEYPRNPLAALLVTGALMFVAGCAAASAVWVGVVR